MSKSKITIWDRAFELSVVYECYAGEEVLESQREAFALLEDNAAEVAESLKAVKKYVRKTGLASLQTMPLRTSSNMLCRRAFLYHIPRNTVSLPLCAITSLIWSMESP